MPVNIAHMIGGFAFTSSCKTQTGRTCARQSLVIVCVWGGRLSSCLNLCSAVLIGAFRIKRNTRTHLPWHISYLLYVWDSCYMHKDWRTSFLASIKDETLPLLLMYVRCVLQMGLSFVLFLVPGDSSDRCRHKGSIQPSRCKDNNPAYEDESKACVCLCLCLCIYSYLLWKKKSVQCEVCVCVCSCLCLAIPGLPSKNPLNSLTQSLLQQHYKLCDAINTTWACFGKAVL